MHYGQLENRELRHFSYHNMSGERAKYDTLLHCKTGQKHGRKAQQQNGRTKRPKFGLVNVLKSGIINFLFDDLTYNTGGHFPRC